MLDTLLGFPVQERYWSELSKILQGLEHLSYEERLRGLAVSAW